MAAAGLAYADDPPELCIGCADGSPSKKSSSGDGCTIWVDHRYAWNAGSPPLNNHPHEDSLYPGDQVRGVFTWGSSGCSCGTNINGPDAAGAWSSIRTLSTGQGISPYIQEMKIIPARPVPGSSTQDGYLQTAKYDDGMGRSRTHFQGVAEGHGMTTGASFSIQGYTKKDDGTCKKLAASVSLTADFRYRNPFWETSIHEQHILTQDGYPASNLDHSNYPMDAIPLEVGSNLVLGAYRWETIKITHLVDAPTISEFRCASKTCPVDLPAAPPSGTTYIGNAAWSGVALNPPWHGSGRAGQLDDGEAMFVVPATKSGPIRVYSTMTNAGQEVARAYNTTWQFVPSYHPILETTTATNTALGGGRAQERPVSVVISYNGTLSDTLHYCSTGVVHDRDGGTVPVGDRGSRDAWGRAAGAPCPEERADNEWGTINGDCPGPCTYVVHPDRPAAFGWGRWSAVNPETRAMLGGFAGEHVLCPPGGRAGGTCTTHDTPWLNWDYVPGTDRDFVPACVMGQIAEMGGEHTNKPKPDDWGLATTWGFGETFMVGEGAEPHTYRGMFSALSPRPPQHYVVDGAQCEDGLLPRACVARGAECRPEYDRRCEDVFTPFLYPDDYIMAGHQHLQGMVVDWCGPTPTGECALEAYEVIDEVMVAMCGGPPHNVDYQGGAGPVIDMSVMDGSKSRFTPNTCHNAHATQLFVPWKGGVMVDDWRACYGVVPPKTDPPSVWPDGKPDADPADLCRSLPGGAGLALPTWDGAARTVYVPYTPTTGAFGGVVERPGNMLTDDGTLTCSCDDLDGNGICDRTEAAGAAGQDLDGNGIVDDWDTLTVDGAVECLDRTGTAAAAAASCWAKYGRNSLEGSAYSTATGLAECLAGAGRVADGPDGECNPAIILGRITDTGRVDVDGLADPEGLGRDLAEFVNDPDLAPRLAVPFLGIGGIIPIPYIVDGKHAYCDESEPWCISSGDTYLQHTPFKVCQDPGQPVSVKRIPAPATIPPLYQPIFDEHWPPACLPDYPVEHEARPDHPVSLDLHGLQAEWPTIRPGAGPDERTPSHVSAGGPATMMLHAGTGVVRFAPCVDCDGPLAADGSWRGTIMSSLGGSTYTYHPTLHHPPPVINQQGTARVLAVEPCDNCKHGWRNATDQPGVDLVVTAFPVMSRPVAEAGEMLAHACQVDGDRGTGLLNIDSAVGRFSSWMDGGMAAFISPGRAVGGFIEFWNEISCRDSPGISITIQDYEAARYGVATKREAGQPWTVASGVNDVSVEVLRNGLWLSTLSILEHRGQCTTYTWSPDVTPGHTACPATLQDVMSCIRSEGDMRWCMDRYTDTDLCTNVYVEDGIHKKWEFTGEELHGKVRVSVDAAGCAHLLEDEMGCVAGCEAAFEGCAAGCGGDATCVDACGQDLDSCSDGCVVSSCIGDAIIEYAGCGASCHMGGVPVVYRMDDGSYGRLPGPDSQVEAMEAGSLAWAGSGESNILLRCEAAVSEDGRPGELMRDVLATQMDFNVGGSFACQEVQACKRTTTNYKCMGGEVVPHVVCEEPADSFSVVDMPYEEVMGSVGPQALHVEAVCPSGHRLAGPGSPGCDGRPIYDTHTISEGTDHTLVYVDYHGVGELRAGRDDPGSRTVNLRAPATFGSIHEIVVEWEGRAERMRPETPCTFCQIEHAGDAFVTVRNVYGAMLTAEVAAYEPTLASHIGADRITGTIWLYLPVLAGACVAYVVIRKYQKQMDVVWDDDG